MESLFSKFREEFNIYKAKTKVENCRDFGNFVNFCKLYSPLALESDDSHSRVQ